MNITAPSAAGRMNRGESLVRAVLVGLLFVVPALLCLRVGGLRIADPDIGWHLETGRWILAHHAFPQTDPFSRVTGGSPWQAYSWLFDLILLESYRWLGLSGIMVLTAAFLLLITASVYHMVSGLQGDFTLRVLLTAAILISLTKLSTPRPWLFTMLFFVWELDVLMRVRQGAPRRNLLWLPLIFLLWANVHIQWVDGLVLLGLAACEPWLAKWWKSETTFALAGPLWLTLGACMAAVCVNPYGPRIYHIAWQLASQPGVLHTVSEEQALTFRFADDYLLLFLALLAAGVLFRFRRLVPFETLMLAAAAVISFRSRRDVWFMAFTAGAILAAGLPVRADREDRQKAPAWALLLSAAIALAGFWLIAWKTPFTNQRLESLLAERMPVRAVAALQAGHQTGALFNTYDWGGFLIWQMHEPVSIDGRAALYGDQDIDRSLNTWNGGPDWSADPDLRSARVVIAPHGAALTQLLHSDQRYAVAYEDSVATVFVTRHAAETGLERSGISLKQPGKIMTEVTPVAAVQAGPINPVH
jgi:hypothetical protein